MYYKRNLVHLVKLQWWLQVTVRTLAILLGPRILFQVHFSPQVQTRALVKDVPMYCFHHPTMQSETQYFSGCWNVHALTKPIFKQKHKTIERGIWNQTIERLALLLTSKLDSKRQRSQHSPNPHSCLTVWQPRGSKESQSGMVAKHRHPPRATRRQTPQQPTPRKYKIPPCYSQVRSTGPKEIMAGKSDFSNNNPKVQQQTPPESKVNSESPVLF